MKKILLALVALFIVVPLLLTSGCGGGGGSSSGGSGGGLGTITFRVIDKTGAITANETVSRNGTHDANAAWVTGRIQHYMSTGTIKPVSYYRGYLSVNGLAGNRTYCSSNPFIKDQVVEGCASPLAGVTSQFLQSLIAESTPGDIVVVLLEAGFP